MQMVRRNFPRFFSILYKAKTFKTEPTILSNKIYDTFIQQHFHFHVIDQIINADRYKFVYLENAHWIYHDIFRINSILVSDIFFIFCVDSFRLSGLAVETKDPEMNEFPKRLSLW